MVSIHISAGLSGTLNSARAAAEQVPGKRIRVVDSGVLSLGLGYLAALAAEAAAAGTSIDEVWRWSNPAAKPFCACRRPQRVAGVGFAQAGADRT